MHLVQSLVDEYGNCLTNARRKAQKLFNTMHNKALHHDCLQLRSFLTPLPAAGEFGRCVAARGLVVRL